MADPGALMKAVQEIEMAEYQMPEPLREESRSIIAQHGSDPGKALGLLDEAVQRHVRRMLEELYDG